MVATTLELNPTRQGSLEAQLRNVERYRSREMSKQEFNSIINRELKNPSLERLQGRDQKQALAKEHQLETQPRKVSTGNVVPIRNRAEAPLTPKPEQMVAVKAEPAFTKPSSSNKTSSVEAVKPTSQSSSLFAAAKAHKESLVKPTTPEPTATHQAKDVSSRVNPTVQTNITPQMEPYLAIAKDIGRQLGGDQALLNKLLQKAEQGLSKQDFNNFRELLLNGKEKLV